MERYDLTAKSYALIMMLILIISAVEANATLHQDGKPFAVKGMQIDVPLPPKAKLAFMIGDDEGEFLAEYTFGDEPVERWKKSLITLYRSGLPLVEAISRRLANLQHQCPSIQLSEFNLFEGKYINAGIVFAYYCEQKTDIAPFGESGVTVILADNNTVAHMITQAWRPQTEPKIADIFGMSQFDLLLLPSVVSGYASFCDPEQGYPCQFDKQNPASHQYPSAVVDLGKDFEFKLPSKK